MPALAVAPSIPGTVFAEAAGGGLVKSSDFGNTWARLPSFNRCEYINKIIINPADANELLILSEAPSAYYGYDEILRSQDGGNTWTNIFSNRVEDIAVNKSDFDRIFAVGKNDASSVMALHKTTNGGAEWSTFDITSVQGESCAVDIDPTNDNTIYVGGGYYPSWSYVGCIFKSTDGGQSWTKAWEGKEDVKAIAVDPGFPSRIYAGTSDGLYRSEDQGSTWTSVLDTAVTSILVNPAAANEVFALDYYGVWFSTDWGATWEQMNTGLTTTPLCLDANWTNRILYAGMSGRAWNSEPTAKGGVFRTFLPGTPSMPTVSGYRQDGGRRGDPRRPAHIFSRRRDGDDRREWLLYPARAGRLVGDGHAVQNRADFRPGRPNLHERCFKPGGRGLRRGRAHGLKSLYSIRPVTRRTGDFVYLCERRVCLRAGPRRRVPVRLG